MREQPGVNALEMECVAAFWEKPELVIRLELAETDGAVEGVLYADDGLVQEEGQGVDEGLVDSGVMELEQLLELALQGGGAAGVFRDSGGGLEQASSEEMEEAGDEEDDC